MIVVMMVILTMVMTGSDDSGFNGEVQVSVTSPLQCSAQVRENTHCTVAAKGSLEGRIGRKLQSLPGVSVFLSSTRHSESQNYQGPQLAPDLLSGL